MFRSSSFSSFNRSIRACKIGLRSLFAYDDIDYVTISVFPTLTAEGDVYSSPIGQIDSLFSKLFHIDVIMNSSDI